MIRADSKAALMALIPCSMLALPAAAAEEPSATPYRPTVSNPAALPVPGYLEMELGATHARGGEERMRRSFPVIAKYAFSDSLGVLIGSELGVTQTGHDGEKASGLGDTTLQLKLRHELTKDSALGLEAGVKAPTAKRALGSRKTDYLLNGIYSSEIGDYALDLNLGYTNFGVSDAAESRHGMSWAAAIGRALGQNWGIAIELSGAARKRERGLSQFMIALSYDVSKQVVLDAAIAVGLSKSAPDRALLAGATILFR